MVADFLVGTRISCSHMVLCNGSQVVTNDPRRIDSTDGVEDGQRLLVVARRLLLVAEITGQVTQVVELFPLARPIPHLPLDRELQGEQLHAEPPMTTDSEIAGQAADGRDDLRWG